MLRSSSLRGFTLIEMLTVMLIIAILAGIILNVNGLVQTKAARARADGEIKALSLFCENYKTDTGSYPRNTNTDQLDAKVTGNPTSTDYQMASRYLYIALSGDTNANGRFDEGEGKNYAGEFFKPAVLNGNKDGSGAMSTINFIKDPFDNSYGYSTIGAKDEEDFQEKMRTTANTKGITRSGATHGFNPTFDLWSTAGAVGATPVPDKWVKNW